MSDQSGTLGRVRAGVNGRSLRDGLGRLVALAFVVFLVPFVLFAIPQLVGAQHSYVVLSGSMEPTIETGSVVLVTAADPADIESGDVITFGEAENAPPTTHRVVGVRQENGQRTFVTKGDNNEDPDRGTVGPAEVIGRVPAIPVPGVGPVLLSFPLVGYLITFGQTQLGMVLLVALPFGLLAADSAIRLVGSAGGDDSASRDGERVDSGLAVSPRTLLLLAVGLGIGGVGLVWHGVVSESVLFVTFGTGLLTTGLLAGLLLWRGNGTAADDHTDAEFTVAADRVPARLRDWPVLEVESRATLREASAADGALLVRPAGADRPFLFRDGMAYTPSTDEDDGSTHAETVGEYLDESSGDAADAAAAATFDWDAVEGTVGDHPMSVSDARSGTDGSNRRNGGPDD